MPSPIVAVVTFDHFSPFHCAVPCLIFGDILPGQPLFELRLCCGDASIHSHSTQGFTIQAPYGLEGLTEADIIVIPFWHDPAARPPAALLDAMIADPILIERPLVETEKGVRLCRPQDVVLEIL